MASSQWIARKRGYYARQTCGQSGDILISNSTMNSQNRARKFIVFCGAGYFESSFCRQKSLGIQRHTIKVTTSLFFIISYFDTRKAT